MSSKFHKKPYLRCAYLGQYGVDEDILDIFFNLDRKTLNSILTKYGKIHGKSAEKYARDNYYSWKKGFVKPNSNTLWRIINLLPPLLRFDTRCELLKKVREKNKRKEYYNLRVNPINWKGKLIPLAKSIVDKAKFAELPITVEQRLKWLSENDMQAAKALLAKVEKLEGDNAIMLLEREFQNIENLLSSLPRGRKVIHKIELPYGTINLTIKRSWFMKENEKQSLVPKTKTESIFVPNPEDVFDGVFAELDEKQARDIKGKIAEEQVKIIAQGKVSNQKYENAAKDINRFINNASSMDSGFQDYSMTGEFESASGITKIQVSRQWSKAAIVVAVVIGLILILFFLTRR